MYYQKTMAAEHFKKITCKDGIVRYEPCLFPTDFADGEILPMTYEKVPPNSLLEKDISFDDLLFVFKNTKPSINFWDVNTMFSFESKNPNPTIYDQLAEINGKNGEIRKKKLEQIFDCIFPCCKNKTSQ